MLVGIGSMLIGIGSMICLVSKRFGKRGGLCRRNKIVQSKTG